jgi:hypothetical protein
MILEMESINLSLREIEERIENDAQEDRSIAYDIATVDAPKLCKALRIALRYLQAREIREIAATLETP